MLEETRLKRLRFRAWRRGFREADLILGPFADTHGQSLTPVQLETFEILLEQPDPDLYAWIIGRLDAPAEFDTDVLAMIRDFHLIARVHRGDNLGA
jgi:antitoxin CptB